MSGPEGSSNKHCIVCAVGIFCPEHSTLIMYLTPEYSPAFLFVREFGVNEKRAEMKRVALIMAVLILAASGMAGMWAAVFADVGVALICVLNAMRVMR